MVQFLSIFFFSWISSIFIGFFKSSHFFVSSCIFNFDENGLQVNNKPVSGITENGSKNVQFFFFISADKMKLLGRMHTHRLFAGVGSGSGRGVFYTYRHYRCRWSV